MKKITIFAVIVGFLIIGSVFAQETTKGLLIDDFEDSLVAVKTIDAGATNGSMVHASIDPMEKHSGAQSLKIKYDAVSGGDIWVSRGAGSGIPGAVPWLVELDKIAWANYGAISFYLKGMGSGALLAFDVKDAGGEIFRFMVKDNDKDWKQVVCAFDQFFSRGDWQPANAEKNGVLDFPIKSFQFEPITVSKGVIYIDEVALEPLN
jgi:hypothetical protein